MSREKIEMVRERVTVYDRLREPFEEAAYSSDTSRGFELTSIKAAYVFERLNEVFGLCGIGWRYAHAPFEEIDNEICTEIALQWETTADAGDGPIEWDNMVGHWRRVEGTGWSAPIFSPGGKQIIKGRRTDARKSAVTDGITKAASMIGAGSDVFKGLVRVGNRPQQQSQQQQPSPQAQAARERAKQPAADGKWTRPMLPAQVKAGLNTKAGQGGTSTASDKQIQLVASKWAEVWAGDKGADQKYHICLDWLLGKQSAKDLTKGEATAVLDLLMVGDGNYDIHPAIDKEMGDVLVAANKDAGQKGMMDEWEQMPQ